jgi:hypothetical protein
LPFGACREQELPGAAGDAEGHRRHVARDEPHDVPDREHRRDRPARRIDPQRDVGVGVFVGERQQLSREQGPVVVVEDSVQDQNASLE